MTTSHRSTLNRWPLTCFMTGRDQVWNLDGSFKTIVEQQQQGRSCMCFFCSLFFSILSPWLFFVEVILAVRVIWIDVSTFECIFESICRAGHSIPSAPHQQSSRARIPGVPKIGVQNLLLHTATLWWWWEWLRSCALQKRSFCPILHFDPEFHADPTHLLFFSNLLFSTCSICRIIIMIMTCW